MSSSPAWRPWDRRGLRFHLTWTRGFIRDFGWRSYIRTVWVDTWVYRFKNWRCWLGHDLGETQWSYEEHYRYEGWRYCQRPRCEFCRREDD